MKTTAAATTAALTAAMLIPTSLCATPYVASARTYPLSNTAINAYDINAHNGTFLIGDPTRLATPVCGASDDNCNPFTTIITGPTGANNNFWMGITADGGQQIFVEKSGRLGYAAVYTDNLLPSFAYTNGFEVVADTTGDYNVNGFPFLNWGGAEWFACPDADVQDAYAVYAEAVVGATATGNCTSGVDLAACTRFHFRIAYPTRSQFYAPEYYD